MFWDIARGRIILFPFVEDTTTILSLQDFSVFIIEILI